MKEDLSMPTPLKLQACGFRNSDINNAKGNSDIAVLSRPDLYSTISKADI